MLSIGNTASPGWRIDRSHHGRLIRSKRILRAFYQDAYEFFRLATPKFAGRAVEIGSGSGFIREVVPDAVTTDVVPQSGIDLVATAAALPFASDSLRAIYLLDALHHFPNVSAFWREAARCLKSGGVVAMVEPANTRWSRFVFQNFHHEPFEPDAAEWEFRQGDPMLAANGALPWIVFCRDQRRFATEFPQLEVRHLEHCLPLTYLASGGLTFPQLIPTPLFPLLRGAERILRPLNRQLGMFMRVVVVRR